jgi:hypothetical protein
MAIEGKFSDSGLQAMDDGADVLTTLARELVMHQGVGQSADEVWRALQRRNNRRTRSQRRRRRNPQLSRHKSPCRVPLPCWYSGEMRRQPLHVGESLQRPPRISSRCFE